MKEEEKMKLENEVLELRAEVGNLERRIENMDSALEPVRRTMREIQADLQLMYVKEHSGVYRLDLADEAGKAARKPLFSRLLYISEHHGREFNKRRELADRSNAYKRQIKRIERELERKKTKKTKDTPEGRLF